jgi:hypothetical protein
MVQKRNCNKPQKSNDEGTIKGFIKKFVETAFDFVRGH